MLRDDGSATGGATYFGNMIGDNTFEVQLLQKQIAVAQNGGEEIVEVVRDTTGELSKRLHFL